MNNLPENENNIQEDEFSTIFSNPTEHKKVEKTSKGKRLKKILSLTLVVAILLGGTFAVIKLIPKKEENEATVNEEIKVVEYESDKIEELTVKNQNGTFNFYSKVVKEEATTKGEEPTETTYWYMKKYDKELTDSDLILQVVSSVVNFTAIREINSKSVEECELDNPISTAEFVTTDDKKVKVLVGGQSPDGAGVYVKLSSSDTIYLVGNGIEETLNFTDLDFASTEAQPAINLDDKYAEYYSEETLATFDTITVSGEKFPQKLVVIPNNNELISPLIPYLVTSPIKRDATGAENLFYIFSQGFNVSGAYSYDVSNKTINSLGLNKPDYVFSAKFDDYTYTYKFKQQEDGDFAVIGNDSKNVKRVSSSDCTFLTTTITDYYSKTLFSISIQNVKNLTLKTPEKTYSFDISANTSGEGYIIKCDGKTFRTEYFQSFYQYLCMLETMDFTVESTSEKPSLTIIYTFNDNKTPPMEVEFVKTSATKFQYSVDGVKMGKIGSSSYNKVLKYLERLLEGKSITVN